MSSKMRSSSARSTAGFAETGSPTRCCTRVVVASLIASARPSIRHNLAVFFHDLFDQVRAADYPLAFGDQVVLGHVEKIEVGRAAVEPRARLVCVLDEVVDRLGRARLDEQLLGDTLL